MSAPWGQIISMEYEIFSPGIFVLEYYNLRDGRFFSKTYVGGENNRLSEDGGGETFSGRLFLDTGQFVINSSFRCTFVHLQSHGPLLDLFDRHDYVRGVEVRLCMIDAA